MSGEKSVEKAKVRGGDHEAGKTRRLPREREASDRRACGMSRTVLDLALNGTRFSRPVTAPPAPPAPALRRRPAPRGQHAACWSTGAGDRVASAHVRLLYAKETPRRGDLCGECRGQLSLRQLT